MSEGNGEAARIWAYRVRDLNKIQSEAFHQVEEIPGLADTIATENYVSTNTQIYRVVEIDKLTITMPDDSAHIGIMIFIVLSVDSDFPIFLRGIHTTKEFINP